MKFLVLGLFLVGCGVNTSVNTSGDININPDDIRIVRKNNLCFALVASRKAGHYSTSGLGLAHVPCEKLGE